ncbi:MAG: hypothetical protein CO126_11670 [Hydrogenophilales bacterium CG_4_9_14_3_um_filter_63_34]|nr:MAG: hypothetical protein CO126_11670 [Hydrogenophilales bacterium CG_4_9_14_3_um_filter_63_34]
MLETLLERGLELGHEQGMGGGQAGDIGGVQGEIVLGRMAGAASPTVAGEGFVEEEMAPVRDPVAPDLGGGRALPGCQ